MRLMYLRESAISQLKENKMNNIPKYKSGESWIAEYLAETLGTDNLFMESRLSYEKVELRMPLSSRENYDGENAILIYNSLKHLTLTQASDERIWTYLTHEVYHKYMAGRWLKNDKEPSKGSLDRYFAYNNQTLNKNGIARLWWGAYITFDEDRENPFELTELLFKSQDMVVGLERSLGNNKAWVKRFLNVINSYEYSLRNIIISSKNIQSLFKYINYVGGVSMLFSMDEDSIKKIVEQWLEKQELLVKV